RLLELCNVKIEGQKLIFHSKEISEARRVNARIIHWVKYDDKVKVKVLKAEGDKLEKIEGYGEKIVRELKEGEIVQFMRFGFVRIDKIDNEEIDAVFSHE
ncbi:glutamate--tRNA ligase, partial [Sulfolobus sp. A20-N-G8]